MGDSLTVQARASLRAQLDHYTLKVGALFGEGISGGALSRYMAAPIMPAVAADYAQDQPDVLVIALGTNDVWQPGYGADSFEMAWHHTLRQFPGACTVGVTVTETDQVLLYSREEAQKVNRVIRRTADVVIDWAEIGKSPDYTTPDNIHLTANGRTHFAELIAAGVAECAART